jgi:SAM-dependent methyltransferase
MTSPGVRKTFAVQVARFVMQQFPRQPTEPTDRIGDLQEVFRHPIFINADETTRVRIMNASSTSKYEGERVYPWDQYFTVSLSDYLVGRNALDLGCFTGGRTIAWLERYRLASVAGVDVDPVYVEAAEQFASQRLAPAVFRLGAAESIPFDDSSFDVVLSFDVLEHVRSVRDALRECARVLRPRGLLIAVFPSYFQPNEHHLGLATSAPALQLVFSGSSLVRAYYDILDERGAAAEWYRRNSPDLETWERGHTLNGVTFGSFMRLVEQDSWDVLHVSRRPIGSVGRNITKWRPVAVGARVLWPLTFIPGAREIFLHRIAVILRRAS